MAEFADLVGKTLVSVENVDNQRVEFTTTDGSIYRLYHEQNCCESVEVEDVVGDFADLVGSPILMAEEATNREDPPKSEFGSPESFTWTFYKLATVKGYVTIRWYGESNGYYSEYVSFEEVV